MGFLNSSNDIVSRDLGKIPPYHKEFSEEIELEKNRKESYMEISEDGGEDTEVDANSEFDVCSESGNH